MKHLASENITKAILLSILNSLFFAIITVLVKSAGNIPSVQKIFYRNIISAIVLFIVIKIKKEDIKIPKNAKFPLLMRCIIGFIAMIMSFYAYTNMKIADANMLKNLAPIFTAITAFFVLKENIPKSNWLAYAFSIGGCLLILKPGGGNIYLVPGIICTLSSVLAGFSLTMLRKMGTSGLKGLPSAYYFTIFCTICSAPWIVFDFHPISSMQLFYLGSCGLLAALYHVTLSYCYSIVPCGRVSIYSYMSIFFGGILGFVFFKEIPDNISLIGYLIIICVAIFLFRRDHHLKINSGPSIVV